MLFRSLNFHWIDVFQFSSETFKKDRCYRGYIRIKVENTNQQNFNFLWSNQCSNRKMCSLGNIFLLSRNRSLTRQLQLFSLSFLKIKQKCVQKLAVITRARFLISVENGKAVTWISFSNTIILPKQIVASWANIKSEPEKCDSTRWLVIITDQSTLIRTHLNPGSGWLITYDQFWPYRSSTESRIHCLTLGRFKKLSK